MIITDIEINTNCSDFKTGNVVILERNTPIVMEIIIETQRRSNVFLSEDCLSDLPERRKLFSMISDKNHKK